jgi:alpha-tubulin suppressor-like RCC1 family protein
MLILKSDGTVWAFGSNGSGQLGDGTATSRATPVQVSGLTNVTAIAAGSVHSLALKADGTLWTWGSNSSGRLGDGTTTQRNRPVQITALSNIVAIAGGSAHSLAVRSDGTVWAWGSNANGQLGDGGLISHSSPAQIASINGIAAVAAGDSHSLAITSTGSLYAWGNNGSGRLGDGTTSQRTSPALISGISAVVEVDAGVAHTVALTAGGTVYCWGDNLVAQLGDGTVTQRTIPTAVPGLHNAVAIAAGAYHSMSIGTDGAISAWGWNDWGQIGDGTAGNHLCAGVVFGLNAIAQVAAGDNFALALRTDGTVLSWGDNSAGQLGNGSALWRTTPVSVTGLTGIMSISVGAKHALALKSDGSVWAWGSNGSGQLGDGTATQRNTPVRVNTPTGITAIAAGDYHSMALRNDGTLWAWGSNGSGRLGIGNTTQKNSPVQVTSLLNVASMAGGSAFSLASKTDGSVWAWGSNSNGQLGDGTTTSRTTPGQILSLTGVSSVVAGDSQSFALTATGRLYAWGNNGSGRLGDGTTTQRLSPTLTASGINSVSASSGVGHTLALSSTFQLFGWGDNLNGQLGDGTTTQRNSPVSIPGLSNVIMSASGAYFSLGLRADGTVLAWGSNDSGQLGDGTLGMGLAPTQVTSPSEALAVDTVRTVAAGTFHTVALGSNGMVWAWGLNSSGQLGDTTTTERTLPSQVVGLRNIKAVAAGEYHTIALTNDGKVVAWGQNKLGQLGNGLYSDSSSFAPVLIAGGTQLSDVIAIATGSYHNLALTADGKVFSWGSNSNGQLGLSNSVPDQPRAVQIPNLPPIAGITAGAYHSLARTGTGTLVGWGANFYGALGSAVGTETNAPVAILPELTNVVRIGAGAYHSLATKGDGTSVAWGWNGYGQLGDNTTINRNTAVPILNLPNVKAFGGSLLIAGHSAGATSAGTLETWGGNSFAQLGDGSVTNSPMPAVVNNLPSISSFAVGGYHTVAVTVDGLLYVWGYNAFGQLGIGTKSTQPIPQLKGGLSLTPGPGDLDGDNLPDAWEMRFFGNLDQAGDGDPEGDGLVNFLEFQQGSNPTVVDYVSPSPAAASSQLVNGSGRAPAGTGENTIIAGFIIRGDAPKKVMIRALGPSLSSAQPPVTNPLGDPKVELFDSNGVSLGRNDNWRVTQIGGLIAGDQASEIQRSTLAPTNDQESALIVTVPAGNYTAHINTTNNATGIALLEIYDLEQNSSQIVNVSARARLSTGDNVLIGGFTIAGTAQLKVIARALGPSLFAYGIAGALQDPTLELHNSSGTAFAFDDNWRDSQETAILATGIPPGDNREAAIVATLEPGAYTAVVSGKNQTSGVALIEVYALQATTPPDPQAVIAAFTWTFAGSKITMNGSGSSSPFGPITQYDWNWGDGSPHDVKSSPTVTATHTYSGAWSGKTVTLSLKVTDQTGRTGDVEKKIIVGADSDGNGLSDAWEMQYFGHIGVDPNDDPDFDGLSNLAEYQHGTAPMNFDTDNDGISDGYEATHTNANPLVFTPPNQDLDGDGMGALFEATYGLNVDTNDGGGDLDGDGLTNHEEFSGGTDPQLADADGDGLTDLQERTAGTDPWLWDSDWDGLSDGFEVKYGLNPNSYQATDTDFDGDGLTDSDEYTHGTNPKLKDTDGDGATDGDEVKSGADPTDPSDGGHAPANDDKIQVAFQINSGGKTVTANCAVCHHLQVSVGSKIVDAGVTTELRKGRSYDIKLKDKPETWKPALGQVPPHNSTAVYTLWPQTAGENETVTASGDKKLIQVQRDQVLEYLINNQSELLAQGKPWQDSVLGKSASITSVELITPAGDPVESPVDGGDGGGNVPDGANEFTYSTAANGVLTLKLKAKMAGASNLPNIQDKFKFEVDAIGTSTMAWNSANPGGKPTISGDFLTATVTFTGLPQNNMDFGKKKARILFDGAKSAEHEFEVFFSKTATNHPGGQTSSPNWYYYWALTTANKTGTPRVTFYTGLSTQYRFEEDLIYLTSDAALTGIPVWGSPKGIDSYGWSTAHEAKHRAQDWAFWPSGHRDITNDSDADYIPNDQEGTYMPGRTYLPNNQQTFLDTIGYGPDPNQRIYDWEDIDMRSQTPDYSLDVLWENGKADGEDWANPGKNSKTKY